jgi:hypothetical protein
MAFSGVNAGDFAQTNTCGTSVAAGASCTISVTFRPTAGGSRTATLAITDNAAGSPHTVGLAGTGTVSPPAVGLSPSSLSFGNQVVNTTSGARGVTLTNTGGSSLTISGVALSGANAGDFAQTNTCGTSVAAGASCTISVTFRPTGAGSRSASLAITDDAVGSPHTVALTGVGTTATVSLSPTSLAFGGQLLGTSSGAQAVTVTNTGTATVTISSLTLGGAQAGDFSKSDTCNASVAVGASCTINATFRPTGAGARSGSVSMTDNASGSPHSVALSGTGTDFALGPAPGASSSASVAAGQTASYALAVTPVNGFTGTVGASCSGAPAAAVCTATPTSVSINGGAANLSVSVTTTARAAVVPPLHLRYPPLVPVAVLGLAAMLVVLARGYGKQGRRVWRLATVSLGVLVMAGVVSLGGCAGLASSSSPPPPPPGSGTPAGTYTLTVSASSQGVARTTSLTLTVQ